MGCKLIGSQFGALDKRFFAIRFIHITDGVDDLSLRAHRIRAAIKAIERLGVICKKSPFGADLLRWFHIQVAVEGDPWPDLIVTRLWGGLMVGFSFVFEFRSYWN